jgi:hypothetical protein
MSLTDILDVPGSGGSDRKRDILLNRGAVVIALQNEIGLPPESDFIPFRLLRLSRAQENERTKPQSHVYCNELVMTDEVYTFEQSPDDIVVRFQQLLTDPRSSTPMVVPADAVDIMITSEGKMAFALDPDFIEDVVDALDGRQYGCVGLADFDTDSSEDDGLDSVALRKHMMDRRLARRIDFSQKVDENLQRGARDRRPVRHLVGDFAF